MTKGERSRSVGKCKDETRNALQTLFDNVNKGQKKQLVKIEEIKNLFDTFGVKYEN